MPSWFPVALSYLLADTEYTYRLLMRVLEELVNKIVFKRINMGARRRKAVMIRLFAFLKDNNKKTRFVDQLS